MGAAKFGASEPDPSADHSADPIADAIAAAEDEVIEVVFTENRAVAQRCRGIHTMYLRHEDQVRARVEKLGSGQPDWSMLDPFDHACQSLVAATGVTYSRSKDMVGLAVDVHEWAGPVLDALDSGLMCERIAMLLCDKVRDVGGDLREEIIAAVVEDYLRRLRNGERPSRQAISRNAGRLIEKLDPEGAAQRRREAAGTRSVRFRKDDDGMCTMTARLTSAAGALLAERIDAFSGKAASGDSRTLAQRRADSLVAMATGEHIVVGPDSGSGSTASQPRPTPADPADPADLADLADPADPGDPGDPAETGSALRGPNQSSGRTAPTGDGSKWPYGPPAPHSHPHASPVNVSPVLRPQITIIATGVGEPTLEFARTGESTMEALNRLLASAQGARFELVDTRPGTHNRRGNDTKYRISPELARRIRSRDGTCRHPGCSVHANDCDIDHIVPFNHSDPDSGGLTIEENLMCLCRRHHRYKTFSKARYDYVDQGRIRVVIGRHVLTTDPTGPLGRARSRISTTPTGRKRGASPSAGGPIKPAPSPPPPIPDDEPPPF